MKFYFYFLFCIIRKNCVEWNKTVNQQDNAQQSLECKNLWVELRTWNMLFPIWHVMYEKVVVSLYTYKVTLE
jgi:hypothetical protein